LVVINVERFEISNSIVGKLNFFTGPMSVCIGNDVKIGFRNRFNCGIWVAKNGNYKRTLRIEDKVLITNAHHFDVAGEILVGECTVIAGIGSQFWTHGNGAEDVNIEIGSDCYIGSSALFCPGGLIAKDTVIGAGAIISKKYKSRSLVITASKNIVREK
jgi:acetyltransferase-like isoleucine patch superfamily enzyme